MKKYISFIVIAIILIVLVCVKMINHNDLQKEYFVSFGNNSSSCDVIRTNESEGKIIKKYNKYDYVKIDKIVDKITVNYDELIKIIGNSDDNEFEYGIMLFDNIVLLAEEINSNQIINWDDNLIDFEQLNEYLKIKNIDKEITKIENLIVFKTESKYLQDGNFVVLSMKNGYNRRSLDKIKLKSVIDNSTKLLMSLATDNGKYIYGYRTNNTKELTSYNILRHAGTTWSLIVYYKQNPNKKLKDVIEKAIEYLLDNYVIKYNDDIYFVEEKKTYEIKLGGNALTLLMLSEYYNVFGDTKYAEQAEKIANGIVYMQQEDGSFYHILDLNGDLKEKYRTVYYDGEATYALLKYYGISNKKEYFESAKRTIDMFLANNYEKYRDHWVSYAMMEFIKYDMDEKYIEFSLNNYLKNIKKIDLKNSFGPIRLELLLSTYKIYNYVLENKSDCKIINNFDISKLKESIEINLNELFEYYVGEEVAMYSDNPSKVMYGFHSINDNFRMRIDDIQHSLLALIDYNNVF